MNLKNEFNRLSDYFNGGMGKAHTATEDLTDMMRQTTSDVTGRMRSGLRDGREALHTAQDAMVRNVKEYPTIYIIAGALLLGLFIARLFIPTERSGMTQREW